MRYAHLLVGGIASILALTSAACSVEVPAPRGPVGNLSIAVAPLSLSGVVDADYTIKVTNGANGTGETVWTEDISSSRYGDGRGSVSYVGTCDPQNGGTNTVTLTLTALYDAAGEIAPDTYQNPTPISLEADCVANTDVAVSFDITLMRDAKQGFFDVAVEFDDIFCSAKLDCQSATGGDLELLHRPGPGGERDMTVVLGFACTGSPTGTTFLYMDDILIDCSEQFPVFGRVRPTGQGNVTPLANPGNYLYGAGVYRGSEALGDLNKAYWNVALGLDETTFATNGTCTILARATASEDPLPLDANGFPLPSGTVYPVIDWSLTLSDAGGRVCTQHEVNAGTGVATTYKSDLPLWPGSGTTWLQHRYERATGEVLSAPNAKCLGRDEVCNGVDDDCDGTIDDGVLSPCGNCDQTCNVSGIGGAVDPSDPNASTGGFDPGDMIGVTYDPDAGGIIIDTVALTSNYLWIPNTNESTLSKWDAKTAVELARYKVGLPAGECVNSCCWSTGCNQPSRVVVDGRGDVYVANRGFGMQGTVTKIAGDPARCADRNNNGTIETAAGATAMTYNSDECVLWTANVGLSNAVLRAIAIDRGDTAHPEGYPWVGSYTHDTFFKLDPDTGATLASVAVPVKPYGAVVTFDNTLWIGTLDSGGIASVNATTGVAGPKINYPAGRTCSDPAGTSYGITADSAGRLWLSGWSCKDALGYDPALGAWTRINTTGWNQYTGRGLTIQHSATDERVWMAVGGDGQANITSWSTSVFAAGQSVTPAMTLTSMPAGHTGPSGVGADAEGFIWLAHHITSQLVRINPTTLAMSSYTGPNRVYTYSDFTGSVRRATIDSGSYVHEVQAACPNPDWGTFSWSATVPQGATVTFSVRTAASSLDLNSAQVVPVPANPSDIGDLLTAAGITPRSVLAITLSMSSGTSSVSPVVNGFGVEYRCPP